MPDLQTCMPDFIDNGDEHTWYAHKWPFPSASQVRNNALHVDTIGRSYCPVSAADASYMELSPSKEWWWVALKNVNQPHLAVRSRINTQEGARYMVRGIGLDFYPRRLIGVVSVVRRRV